jgi:hypothetical protein
VINTPSSQGAERQQFRPYQVDGMYTTASACDSICDTPATSEIVIGDLHVPHVLPISTAHAWDGPSLSGSRSMSALHLLRRLVQQTLIRDAGNAPRRGRYPQFKQSIDDIKLHPRSMLLSSNSPVTHHGRFNDRQSYRGSPVPHWSLRLALLETTDTHSRSRAEASPR